MDVLEQGAAYYLATQQTRRLAALTSIRSDPPKPRDIRFDLYPFQSQVLDAWDSGESNIVLKARQLGMSWVLALYMLRRCAYDGWRFGYWSLGEREAIHQLEARVLHLLRSIPPEIRPKYKRRGTLIEFPQSGGSLLVLPATQKGGTSYTFDGVAFDEFALHAYGAENLEHVQPTISGGGQLILNSTSNPKLGPNGAFYEIWKATEDEMGTDYEVGELVPVFLPWDCRPGRDGAWLEAQRKRYRGLSDAAFRAFFPATPEEAFIGKQGLVFPQFTRERHVRDSHPVPWEECVYRFAGYDLGGGDPTAIGFFGAYRAGHAHGGGWRVHQYGEWYERRTPSVTDMQIAMAPWPGLDWISCDPKEPTLQATLQGLGYPAIKANWRRGEGLGICAQWLDEDWFTIHSDCVNNIREFAGYRWRESTDPHSRERYTTATPVDNHADGKDAWRYAMVEAHYLLLGESTEMQQYQDFKW